MSDHSVYIPGFRSVGVLLIHGLGGTPVEVSALGRSLSKIGVGSFCCQLAGHCGSEGDLSATTWPDWYASAEAGLRRLMASCDTVVVGGLSMGAVMAARLAREYPDKIRGVIMLAPTLWYDGWSIPWYSFLLKALVYTQWGKRYRFVEHEPYGLKDPRMRARILHAMTNAASSNAGLFATPSQALREMWGLVRDVKPSLSRIRQDVLLIQAREDDVASLSNAFYLQKHLGGRVESVILDDCYHLITLDRQRGEVSRRVCAFVQSLEQEAACAPHPIDIRVPHAR